jgi:hypothetical protein
LVTLATTTEVDYGEQTQRKGTPIDHKNEECLRRGEQDQSESDVHPHHEVFMLQSASEVFLSGLTLGFCVLVE